MTGGVTRQMLPQVSGVPLLHVNRPLEVLFEWSNIRILSTDSKVRIFLQHSIINSESEGV